jgi:hypothetical protein
MLSPQVLAQIFERYGDRPDERAHQPTRFPLRNCVATAQPLGNPNLIEPFQVHIEDLSILGLGLRSPRPISPGQLLCISLRTPGLPTQTWRCRIVRVHGHDEYVYWVGALFF